MIDFLNSFKSLVKLEKVHTDNNIFKLHYKFTVIILIIFSILLTSKQYFGEPIDCKTTVKPKSHIDTFCWIHSTYIILSTLDNDILSGLGPDTSEVSTYHKSYSSKDKPDSVPQKYYQWVCIVFCVQALMFYIPRYLWKTWEAGRMRLLVKDLGGPLVTANWNTENKLRLVNYLICRKYVHNCYAMRFAFCELLNFFNVILQIVMTDWFLSGHFLTYGVSILTYTRINPMTLVFPKVTKCKYHYFGPSGSLVHDEALCLLPLNNVNEKLFIFLWFWFITLTLLSFYQLLFRACSMVSSTFREKLLRARCRYLNQKTTDIIIDNFSYGDMFFLDLLAKNLNPIIYKELIVEIATAVNERTGGFNGEVTIPV